MRSHDLFALTVIGFSAFAGLAVTAGFARHFAGGDQMEWRAVHAPHQAAIHLRLHEVPRETTVRWQPYVPTPGATTHQAVIRWWATEAPIRYSGLGAMEKGETRKSLILKPRPEYLGFGDHTLGFHLPRTPGTHSLTLKAFPEKTYREVRIRF